MRGGQHKSGASNARRVTIDSASVARPCFPPVRGAESNRMSSLALPPTFNDQMLIVGSAGGVARATWLRALDWRVLGSGA